MLLLDFSKLDNNYYVVEYVFYVFVIIPIHINGCTFISFINYYDNFINDLKKNIRHLTNNKPIK